MYLTDQFIFIHMFRMGGTTCIEQTSVTKIGYHFPHSMLPSRLSHLPVIGTIRNPYDWYVSVYQHCKNIMPDMRTYTFLNFMMDFKHTTMEDTIERLIDPSWMTEKDKDNALKHFPSFYDYENSKCDNLRKTEFLSYLNGGKGFLSWLFEYMYSIDGSIENVSFCKLESLSEDWYTHTGKKLKETNSNSFEDAPGCGAVLSDYLKSIINNKDKGYIKTFYPELL